MLQCQRILPTDLQGKENILPVVSEAAAAAAAPRFPPCAPSPSLRVGPTALSVRRALCRQRRQE